MDAEELIRRRVAVIENGFADIVVWHVHKPVPGSTHNFKYRLAFVVDGQCVLRYDNESGKGDHRHLGGREEPYIFSDPRQLTTAFLTRSRGGNMNTVTIEVRTLAETLDDVVEAMETLTPSEPRISFETPELLWNVLTAKRWEILKAMAGSGPLALREIARRVGRDIKSVHTDVHALLNAGLINRSAEGFRFPYDAVHVDFLLKAG